MIETKDQVVEKIEQQEKLAYRQSEAAKLLSISRSSLCREIKRGRIQPTNPLRTISREELLRYLRMTTGKTPLLVPSVTARKRVPRNQYKPIPLHHA